MRFAFAATIAAHVALNVVNAAGSESPLINGALVNGVLKDLLTGPDETADELFSRFLAEGNPNRAFKLYKEVSSEVSNQEYIKAFLNNQPDIVRRLLVTGLANTDASHQHFDKKDAESLRGELTGHELREFFEVDRKDARRRMSLDWTSPRKSPKGPVLKKLLEISAEENEEPFTFNSRGALDVACKLRNPSMVYALLITEPNRQELGAWCYRTAYLDRYDESPTELYRAGVKGSWRTVRLDGRENLLTTLLKFRGKDKLVPMLGFAVSNRRIDHFRRLLKEKGVTRNARLTVFEDICKVAGRDPSQSTELADYAKIIVDTVLAFDSDWRGPLRQALFASRSADILNAVPYHLKEEDREDVLLQAIGHDFDRKWFCAVVDRFEYSAEEVSAALRSSRRNVLLKKYLPVMAELDKAARKQIPLLSNLHLGKKNHRMTNCR